VSIYTTICESVYRELSLYLNNIIIMKNVIGLLVLSTLVLASCADSAVNENPDVTVTPSTEVTDTMDNTDMGMDNQNMDNMDEDGVMVGGAMMVPSLDIVDNAMNADNVTTLVAAVSAAWLVDTLKSEGPFTVFAPTNMAFDDLPEGTVDTLLLPENKDMLTNILTYHVVPGSYTSADLEDGMMLTTVQGEELEITYVDNVWYVNGVEIQTADVISSNGVTFVIDSVLMPSA